MPRYIVSILTVFFLANLALAQTTRPSGDRMMRLGERIQQLTAQLNLTDDQKQKIDDILQQARDQFRQELPQLHDATPEQRRAKIQDIVEGVRQEIGDLLTPAQRDKLQDLLQKQKQRQSENATPANTNTNTNDQERQSRIASLLKPHTSSVATTRPSQTETVESTDHPPVSKPVEVGQLAPDIPFHWMSGDTVHLSLFKNEPVVLIFGSYTEPAFRDKAPQLSKLATRYGNRAKIIIVYTKEAHPSDGWVVERNQKDDISLAQPTNISSRREAAQTAIDELHLTSIPVALDTMDNSLATAYDAFPDGVIVLDKHDHIIARQHWLDPSGLPALIDKAMKQ